MQNNVLIGANAFSEGTNVLLKREIKEVSGLLKIISRVKPELAVFLTVYSVCGVTVVSGIVGVLGEAFGIFVASQ